MLTYCPSFNWFSHFTKPYKMYHPFFVWSRKILEVIFSQKHCLVFFPLILDTYPIAHTKPSSVCDRNSWLNLCPPCSHGAWPTTLRCPSVIPTPDSPSDAPFLYCYHMQGTGIERIFHTYFAHFRTFCACCIYSPHSNDFCLLPVVSHCFYSHLGDKFK